MGACHAAQRSQAAASRFQAGGISHARLVLENPHKIHDVYDISAQKLGEGASGFVYKGTHKSTGAVRAIKSVRHNQKWTGPAQEALLNHEIAMVKLLDHPNIVKVFETFHEQRRICLAMELCHGGELCDRIVAAGRFSERSAAIVMKQIFGAVFYLHGRGIAHRDLKPENFLFATKDRIERNVLKLIDFGLACRCMPNDFLCSKVGTAYYVAPQVLSGRYNSMCDLWSCGVILYILLSGHPPFGGETDDEVMQKVTKGAYVFPDKYWGSISADAVSLIKGLLKFNPAQRLDAGKALKHPWIKHVAPRAEDVPLTEGVINNLRCFHSQNRLKKAALAIIAGQLGDAQVAGLRQAFTTLDANGDGLLTLTEFKHGLEQAGIRHTRSDLARIVDGMDADGTGEISYTEFLAAALDQGRCLEEDLPWTAFSVFDLNGDGRITKDELRRVLNNAGARRGASACDDVAELVRQVDANGDGSIDFEEFKAALGSECSTGPGSRSGDSFSTGDPEPVSREGSLTARAGGA